MTRTYAPLLVMLLFVGNAVAVEPDGSGEFSAYTGVLMGLGFRGAVGGTAGYAFNPHAILLFDTAYSPVGNQTIRPVGPVTSGRLYDLSFAVHVPVPIHRRWEPYGIMGGGVLCETYNSLETGKTRQSAYFGFETGGGVRYFVADNWGVRSELKVVISHRTFTRLGIGVFYQFSDWDPDRW